MIDAKENRRGMPPCPYDFYRCWIEDPDAARDAVRAITRQGVGLGEGPIEGIPFLSNGAGEPVA